MIIHLLDAPAGRHTVAAVAAAAVAVKTPLFRRLVPRLRKLAVPGVTSPASGTAVQLAHADAVHRSYARHADAQRPVNGVYLGTLPRRKPMVNRPPWETAELPVYGERPVAEVLAAEAEADQRAAWYQHVPATYRGGWQ